MTARPELLGELDVLEPLAFRSRYPHVWLAHEASLDARGGQVGTLVRASAAAALDTFGVSLSCPHTMPRWEYDAGQARVGLLLSSDRLAWDLPLLSRSLSGIVAFVERGTRTTSGAGLWYIGNDAVSGARVYIDSTGSQYRLVHANGSSSVSSTMSGTPPSTGDLVLLWYELDAQGRVRLRQSINGAAFTAATQSGTLAHGTFGTVTRLRLNSLGTSATLGTVLALGHVLALGVQTEAILRAPLGSLG